MKSESVTSRLLEQRFSGVRYGTLIVSKFCNVERGYYLSPLYLREEFGRATTAPQASTTPHPVPTAPTGTARIQPWPPHSCHSLPPGLSRPLTCPACSAADPQAQRLPRPCCAHSLGGRAAPHQGAKMCSPSDHRQPASEPEGHEGPLILTLPLPSSGST